MKNTIIISILIIAIIIPKFQVEAKKVIIRTPFCNTKPDPTDPSKPYQNEVEEGKWYPDQLEDCYQTWLYSGGLSIKEPSASGFDKRSNYLTNHEILCLDIDGDFIYSGTNDGIWVSSDYGEHWEIPQNFDNLVNNQIFALSINDISGFFYACTNNGIFTSTNNGQSWSQELSDREVKCIAFDQNQNIYIGTDIDVFKYFNYQWIDCNVEPGYDRSVNALFFDGTNLYAGTILGLYKSTDGGANWVNKSSGNILNKEITAVIKYINGNDNIIYVGVFHNSDPYPPSHSEGCFMSSNEGQTWVEKNGDLSYPFPQYQGSLAKLNYFAVFYTGSYFDLYIATDYGLAKSKLPYISQWRSVTIRSMGITSEKDVRMVYVNNVGQRNDIWVATHGGLYFPDAVVVDDFIDPLKFKGFNCHSYAWHLSEDGDSRTGLGTPKAFNYINENENENWDYIQENNWQSTLWEKVTYYSGFSHSAIKSPTDNDQMPQDEVDLILISKWSSGPLMKHRLEDNPWGNLSPTYWKCKKVINGTFEENQFIGRQIVTDGTTEIRNGEDIDFYVAPMLEHKINMTDGFHAQYGCTFHAYVKDEKSYSGCEIPWEEPPRSGKISVNEYDNEDIISALKYQDQTKPGIQLFIYPNPSNNRINILAKINDNKKQCPISMLFYTFDGKIVKSFNVINGVEISMDVDEITSGAYLIAAQADFINNKGKSVSITASEIIIIEK